MSRVSTNLYLSPKETDHILKLFPDGVVALDLETTGLSPLVDKIIEIAAVKITPNGELTPYHQLINPLIDIPEKTIAFHGIKNQDLIFSPTIKKPLKEFWEFTCGLPLIAHNAVFDLGFLIKSSFDFQYKMPSTDVYDSCRFLRSLHKKAELKPENFKLSTLARWAGFDLRHHQALDDAFGIFKIISHSLAHFENSDTQIHKKKSHNFNLRSFQTYEALEVKPKFENLKTLVRDQVLIKLSYRGGTIKDMLRPLRPISLMPNPKGSILFAECLLTGLHKSFLLKKIKSFEVLEACLYTPGIKP